MLFTRDLRVHDNPAFAAAHRTDAEVVPLFARDRKIYEELPLRTVDDARARGARLLPAAVARRPRARLWVVANTRRLFNPELQAKKLAGYLHRWSGPDLL